MMNNIIKVEDKFHISKRGDVYTFKCPKWLELFYLQNNKVLIGEIFRFELEDKESYAKCIGVELFAIDRNQILEGESCRFLIKPLLEYVPLVTCRGYKITQNEADNSNIIEYAVQSEIDLTDLIIDFESDFGNIIKVYVSHCQSDDTNSRLIQIKSIADVYPGFKQWSEKIKEELDNPEFKEKCKKQFKEILNETFGF